LNTFPGLLSKKQAALWLHRIALVDAALESVESLILIYLSDLTGRFHRPSQGQQMISSLYSKVRDVLTSSVIHLLAFSSFHTSLRYSELPILQSWPSKLCNMTVLASLSL
jgi:hypothetical protein